MTAVLCFLVLSLCPALSLAFACGDSKNFKYSFKPILVRPVADDDIEDAHGRCGRMENHCEIVVQVGGADRCKKGGEGNKGMQLRGTPEKNVLTEREFTPPSYGGVHMGEAEQLPFRIQVCDEDSFLRGRNDVIIDTSTNYLTPGCNTYKTQDPDQNHPWFLEYEICCEPLGRPSGGSSRPSRPTEGLPAKPRPTTGGFGGSSSPTGGFGGSTGSSGTRPKPREFEYDLF